MSTPVSKSDQHALIALIVKQAEEARWPLGKKALQKNVHLIQEFGDVDAGYQFSFYTYGPYSSELSGDLDVVAVSGGVEVDYNPVQNSYSITLGKRADNLIERGKGFLSTNARAIDCVLNTFKGRYAKDLELISTIAYLRRTSSKDEFGSNEKLRARVQALKPKYNAQEIDAAIKEARKLLSEKRQHVVGSAA